MESEEPEGRVGVSRRRTTLRRKLEERLEGIEAPHGVSLVNLDSGDVHNFDSYHLALEYIKTHRGRWYLTARVRVSFM